MPNNNTYFNEISKVLQREIECAESLQKTSEEIRFLVEEEKFQQVKEKLVLRGQIIDLIVSLDNQLHNLLEYGKTNYKTNEWKEVVQLAEKLQEIIKIIIDLGLVSRNNLEVKSEEISGKLKELYDGKKIIEGYGRRFKEIHHPLGSG